MADYEYNYCRGVGHSWDRRPIMVNGGLYEIHRVCNECGMERTTVIDRYGRYKRRQYVQPEGYRVPGGMARVAARKSLVTEEG